MKKRGLIRKAIYLVLFLLLGVCFILISEKYKDNSTPDVYVISDYYHDLEDNKYEIIGGTKFLDLLKKEKHIIIIGDKNSTWSTYYMNEVDKALTDTNVSNVYYYDINNDKAQKNSNYYDIIKALKGSLVTTDDNESNLLAPSFYIIEKGKVSYYNVDTVATKNSLKPADYWTEDTKADFNKEITEAINKYYLNNK